MPGTLIRAIRIPVDQNATKFSSIPQQPLAVEEFFVYTVNIK